MNTVLVLFASVHLDHNWKVAVIIHFYSCLLFSYEDRNLEKVVRVKLDAVGDGADMINPQPPTPSAFPCMSVPDGRHPGRATAITRCSPLSTSPELWTATET